MELYTNQLKDMQLSIKYTSGGARVKGSNKKVYKKGKSKCYNIFTFDLENTNAWIDENGNVISYKKGYSADYWNSLQALALVYIWQFGVDNKKYYGRELTDFLQVLDDMPKDEECIIWIHNLGHEFVFLENILTVKEVFARGSHSPIKVVYEEYPNITFRCTYALENLSLDNWGKQIGCKKLVGALDYDGKLRTPLTPLTDLELDYCSQDIEVMYQGLLKEVEQYGNIFNIPLTSTGKVRKVCKKLLFEDKYYSSYIKKMVPDIEELQFLQSCFSGGYTHCNRIHTDTIIDDKMSHWDFTSSYPTVLVAEKYPVSRFRKSDGLYIHKDSDKYAFIYELTFKNIRAINPNTYLQCSKCVTQGKVKRDNGRIISADWCTIKCTDVDVKIIQMLYKYDYCNVRQCWYAYKDYLPRDFLDYILTLYSDKTELKGVTGKEDFYMQQKARLNSLYGMCVTKLVQDNFVYNDNEWHTEFPSYEEVVQKLKELADKSKSYNHEYFVNYAWGVWCTAYARYNLFKCMIRPDTHNGYDICYCDTDSIFTIGVPDYSDYNKEITEKLLKCCKARALDFDKTHPKDIKGIEHPLGIFDREEDIIEFKCLHAKCYCERRLDGKLHLTISGINKGAVEELQDDLNNFKSGFEFSPDAVSVHKLMPIYCYNQPVTTFPDGYVSRYPYGKVLRNTGYKISNTEEYQKMIDAYNLTPDLITDEIMQCLRNGVI